MAKIIKPLTKLCTPAKVYLFLSAMSILGTFFTVSIFTTLVHAVISMIWAFFLGFLCDNNMRTLSWGILFLPLIIMLAVFLVSGAIIFAAVEDDKKKKKEFSENKMNTTIAMPPAKEPYSKPSGSKNMYMMT